MAASVDATSTWSGGSTWNHTITGSNVGILIALVTAGTPASVTYRKGGSTQNCSLAVSATESVSGLVVSLYSMTAPDTGTNTITVNGATIMAGGAISFTNASQTALVSGTQSTTNSGSQSSISVSLTAGSGQVTVDVGTTDGFLTPSGTAIFGSGGSQASQYKSGSGSISMSYSISSQLDGAALVAATIAEYVAPVVAKNLTLLGAG